MIKNSEIKKPIYLNLVKECASLELNGIKLRVNNKQFTVYFVLGLILADNLGMHEILGFTKSFSANYCCRFCKIHKSDLAIQSKERIHLLRNKSNYEDDILKNCLKETGLIQSCVFEALPSFHVTENLAVDIMHDIYEGVCHYDLSHILNYLIDKEYITLSEFNEKK